MSHQSCKGGNIGSLATAKEPDLLRVPKCGERPGWGRDPRGLYLLRSATSTLLSLPLFLQDKSRIKLTKSCSHSWRFDLTISPDWTEQ